MQLQRISATTALIALLLPGCAHIPAKPHDDAKQTERAEAVLAQVRQKFAPDSHLAIFNVQVERDDKGLVLLGEVDGPEAKRGTLQALSDAGIPARDQVGVLPEKGLGDEVWGVATLSVANGREQPEQKAELGTQILMGNTVRIWKRTRGWFYVQSKDGYLSWMERHGVVPCAKSEADAWQNSPLLIVTTMEDQILEQPRAGAQPVSDVVMGDLIKKTGEDGDWFSVELPDGRKGVLPKKAAEEYAAWKRARHPSPEKIEKTARLFLGRPYLWGANSPKGLDCSGLAKIVFLMNGIDLNRNASHQALQGTPVPLDANLTSLKKGDLIFFGGRGRRESPRVTHVGIYLGDRTFIQSSGRVRISSLDPTSPLFDEQYGRSLVSARRVLPQQ